MAILLCARPAFGYSVLTHEQLVDLLWLGEIQPLLVARYPGLTAAQLQEAHAYAYGGAVIDDLGYYPFGNQFFSNLIHYVRSGDFVMEMIRQSENADEYAFALGTLAHYTGDSIGHPGAVNQAVSIDYPKLRRRFGKFVTFDDDRSAHLKTEFGFDMEQVALHRYAPQQYHAYIGFQVSKPLLERVFPVVYGLPLRQVLPNEDLAFGTFRWSVSQAIPEMTQVALEVHKKDLLREDPNFSRKTFLYHISRADYEKDWGGDFQRPGWRTRLLAFLIRMLPKVGPLRALAFNAPTAATENLYIKSINASFDKYRGYLEAVRANSLQLPNLDLDDGKPARPGEYLLTDSTYAEWLARLAAGHFSGTDEALRANLVAFYSQQTVAGAGPQDPQTLQAVRTDLTQLKQQTVLAY